MPLYEYVCPECDVKFERLGAMTDGQAAECPTCGGQSQRLLSMFAAFSKGSEGEVASVAGGACACGAGGTCCSSGDF